MNKSFSLFAFLLLISNLSFALPAIIDFSLNSGAQYSNSVTLSAAITPDWADCNSIAQKWMSFNCVDQNLEWISFSATHSLNLSTIIACNASSDEQKTVYAWIACGETDSLNQSPSKTATITLDKTPPFIKINNNGLSQTSQEISFDLNDNLSGINLALVNVKINNQASTSFNPTIHCIDSASNKNYSCQYIESFLQYDDNYLVEITSTDNAGNQAVQSASFEYLDNTPPNPPTTVSCSSGTGLIQLSWQKNSEPDTQKYNIYRSTTLPTPKNDANRVLSLSHSLCTGSSCSASDSNNLIAGTSYYCAVSVVDKSGDESTLMPASTGCSSQAAIPSAPSLSWAGHSSDSWTSDNSLTISWPEVENATGYSCTWETSSSIEPDNTIDGDYCQNRSLQRSGLSNGTYYLKVRACNSSGCSGISTFIARIDSTVPSIPRNLSASVQSNGDIELDWDEPSTIGSSGISEYRVYRHTNSFSVDSDKRIARISNTYYTDSSSTVRNNKGTRYYYLVTAVSNAGLESNAASISARFGSEEPSISILLPEYAKEETLQIEISSSNAKMEGCILQVKPANSTSFKTIGSIIDNTYKAVRSYTFTSAEAGKAEFSLTCDNLESTITRFVKVDTVAPSLDWISPLAGTTVNGTIDLIIESSDSGYGVKEVSFYQNNSLIGTSEKPFEGKKYKIAWNAKDSNEDILLKAVAKDNAGNTTEKEIKVKTSATEKKAQDAISAAENAKTEAQKTLAQFTSKGIAVPESLALLKREADSLLVSAKSLLGQKDYENAEKNALSAKEKYNKIVSNYSITELHSEETSCSTAQQFLEIIASDSLSREATANLAGANPSRKTTVFKTTENGIEKFVIAIKITLTNKTSDTTIQIVEAIPKTLAKSDNEISSLLPFEVLSADPIIKFKVNAQPESTTTITYFLKTPITLAELQDLNASGALKPWQNPPMPFKESTVVESTAFKPQTTTGTTTESTGFFALGSDLLPVIGIILIIAIILFFAYLFAGSKKQYFEFEEEIPEKPRPKKWSYK
ncbi:MAG: hypothetical protein QXK06_03015 [Candidatus Diapherotrites archaeon]